MRWLAFLGMAFALIAAGCGAGDEQAAPSEETTTEETIPDSGSDKESGDDFCLTLLTARVFIAGAYLDPGSVSQDGLADLADAAPREIRDDIETLAQALATLHEKVGDDPDVLELNAALESIKPKTEPAEKHLDAWERENCKGRG